MNNEEIEALISETISNNKLKKVNNIYLSNKQLQILEKYNINYQDVVNMQELIFNIECYINNNGYYNNIDDLENLSIELAEFNYYNNTKK